MDTYIYVDTLVHESSFASMFKKGCRHTQEKKNSIMSFRFFLSDICLCMEKFFLGDDPGVNETLTEMKREEKKKSEIVIG